MLLSRFPTWTVSVGLMVLGANVVSGQAYPNRTIRIVTTNVGGGSDTLARVLVQGLTDSLGQQVIVDNRPAGPISGELVSKAPPDGYTLLVGSSTMLTAPLLQPTPFDPVNDFSPITLMSRGPNILVVHPSLPVKSIKELIALAKAKPGQLNYGSGASGASSHLAAELFKSMAGVNIVRISYKGGAPLVTALLSGEVQLTINDVPTLTPHVKAGKLKALAVTSAQPSALAPGLPTVSSSGLPGYESAVMQGMFAPAKTPQLLIRRLNQEIVRVLNGADVKTKLLSLGYETVGNSPEEFAATIKSDITKMSKVIKDAGIRAE